MRMVFDPCCSVVGWLLVVGCVGLSQLLRQEIEIWNLFFCRFGTIVKTTLYFSLEENQPAIGVDFAIGDCGLNLRIRLQVTVSLIPL